MITTPTPSTPATPSTPSTPATEPDGVMTQHIPRPTTRIVRSFYPPNNFPNYVLEAIPDKDLPRSITPLTELFRYDTTIDLFLFTKGKNCFRFPCDCLRTAEEVLLRLADRYVMERLQDGTKDAKDQITWSSYITAKPWNRVCYYLSNHPALQPVFFAPKHISEGLLARVTNTSAFQKRITAETLNMLFPKQDFPWTMAAAAKDTSAR